VQNIIYCQPFNLNHETIVEQIHPPGSLYDGESFMIQVLVLIFS